MTHPEGRMYTRTRDGREDSARRVAARPTLRRDSPSQSPCLQTSSSRPPIRPDSRSYPLDLYLAMSSPAPELKRARPKPKPRLKPAGIAAPSVTSVPSELGPKEQSSIVDLTSSSPAHAGSRSSHTTPKRSKVAKGGVSCDDAPSWVVGSHRLDDDVEIVETSTQARLRQRKLSEGSVELDEDQDSTTLDERRRRKEEEEERERLAEEEWMAQARRTVRHVPAASSIAKGKGKGASSLFMHALNVWRSDAAAGCDTAPSLRDSSPIVADGEYDMDDDTDTASATGHEEDEGEFSARNMRRYKRKNQGKHRWMEQTDLAAVALANSSSSRFVARPSYKAG